MFKIKILSLLFITTFVFLFFSIGFVEAGNITASNPAPVEGMSVIFSGVYSDADFPTPQIMNVAKVCWAINTQIQNVCVNAPNAIPNFEYTFQDALLYDVSLEARNKTDNSFIKVLTNISVNVTQAISNGTTATPQSGAGNTNSSSGMAGGVNNNSSGNTGSSNTSSGMAGGVNNSSGSGTVSNCFPNPLKLFRCDDDPGTAMTVKDLVRNIINGIFGLLGAVAVGIIVYGGVIYMTAGASKDGTEKAKKIITSAVIGLIIALLSLAIVDLLFVLLGGR